MAPQAKSVASLLNDINNREINLPDLQRDFVWEENKIRMLLDSIMRGYPFGALLMWNTQFIEVVYREFVRDYKTGQTFPTGIKPKGVRMRMVLDGQQRLQSLYLALHGTYDGRRLYFNVTSGPQSSDEDDPNYRFEFWRDDETNRPKRLVRLADIIRWNSRHERQEIEKVVQFVGLTDKLAELARDNLSLVRRVFVEDIVPIIVIDEDVIDEGQARGLSDILEIFVRVNSGGTPLTRSDLMFSLIKTKWVKARSQFDSLLTDVSRLGATNIDKDFVIRGLLTVADAPPKFDVESIERYWDAMEPKFGALSDALKSTLDFCRSADVRIGSASLLTPLATLFPIIYFLSKQKNGSVPDDQRQALRTLLHFLLFNEFLGGNSPEARIRYLRTIFQRYPTTTVPLDALLTELSRRQRTHAITTTIDMLNWNRRLALNIALPAAAKDTLSWQEKAEVDHIFPQAEYRPVFGDAVDDLGNLAYLGKLRNIRKSKREPSDYFAGLSDDELREDFLIADRKLLAKEHFERFVKERRALILDRVKSFLGR